MQNISMGALTVGIVIGIFLTILIVLVEIRNMYMMTVYQGGCCNGLHPGEPGTLGVMILFVDKYKKYKKVLPFIIAMEAFLYGSIIGLMIFIIAQMIIATP